MSRCVNCGVELTTGHTCAQSANQPTRQLRFLPHEPACASLQGSWKGPACDCAKGLLVEQLDALVKQLRGE